MNPGNPVGLVGVGLMGMAFAQRLRGAGMAVVGFDVDAARLEQLAAIGGEGAQSIAEVVRRCATIRCVRHGEGEKDSTVIVEDIRRRVARPAAARGGVRT
jgi:3-hydroxyisobutyrate dehydrogenase